MLLFKASWAPEVVIKRFFIEKPLTERYFFRIEISLSRRKGGAIQVIRF